MPCPRDLSLQVAVQKLFISRRLSAGQYAEEFFTFLGKLNNVS